MPDDDANAPGRGAECQGATRRGRKRWLWAVASAALIALLGGGLGVYWWKQHEAETAAQAAAKAEEEERAGAIGIVAGRYLMMLGGQVHFRGLLAHNKRISARAGYLDGPGEAKLDRTTGRWTVTKIMCGFKGYTELGAPVFELRRWKCVVYHAPDGWRIEDDRTEPLSDKESQEEMPRSRLRAKAWVERDATSKSKYMMDKVEF
jgi:hypothetical protein